MTLLTLLVTWVYLVSVISSFLYSSGVVTFRLIQFMFGRATLVVRYFPVFSNISIMVLVVVLSLRWARCCRFSMEWSWTWVRLLSRFMLLKSKVFSSVASSWIENRSLVFSSLGRVI